MVSLSFSFMVQERFSFVQRCATSISQRSAVILPVITFQRYRARARPALTPWFYHSKFYHSSPAIPWTSMFYHMPTAGESDASDTRRLWMFGQKWQNQQLIMGT